jgi:hypothetical protein
MPKTKSGQNAPRALIAELRRKIGGDPFLAPLNLTTPANESKEVGGKDFLESLHSSPKTIRIGMVSLGVAALQANV